MNPVPIYYEKDEPDQEPEKYISISNKNNKGENKKRLQISPRPIPLHTIVLPEDKIILFPEKDYGEYTDDLREIEIRYNIDWQLFQQTAYDTPELIPAAEQMQDTLTDLLNGAKLIFEEFSEINGLQDHALELMNRVCKDSYAIGEEVSRHVKFMIKQFPNDEVLHEDLKEIDESFTDFYLDAYSMMVKYRKKIVKG